MHHDHINSPVIFICNFTQHKKKVMINVHPKWGEVRQKRTDIYIKKQKYNI